MSIDHKAFTFNYTGFQTELAEILGKALAEKDVSALTQFIEENIAFLKDPYEAEALDPQWHAILSEDGFENDPHHLGDIALTKFYDPSKNIGLRNNWLRQREKFIQLMDYDYYTLGKKFGPVGNRFDPGKLGSFILSP